MLYTLITTIHNEISYLIIIFLTVYFFSAHISLTGAKLLNTVLTSVVIMILINFVPNENVQYVGFYIILMLSVLLLSKRKIRDVLLLVPAIALYFVLGAVPVVLVNYLFPAFDSKVMLSGQPYDLVGFVVDIVFLGLLILLRHYLVKYDSSLHLSLAEVLGSLGVYLFIMIAMPMLIMVNERTDMYESYKIIWRIIITLAVLIVIGLYLYQIVSRRVRLYKQYHTNNEQKYLELQLHALRDLQENEEQIARTRHDLKNHLLVLQSMYEEGKFKEAGEYTRKLERDINLPGAGILSGNKIADMILRDKVQHATGQSVEFSFQGSLDPLHFMEAQDICGLLGNAYDNALEACVGQENAYVKTIVNRTKNFITIVICNSVAEKVSIKNNHISTTKKDTVSHGLGIPNMKLIVRKYHGKCTLECTDREFRFKVSLPI